MMILSVLPLVAGLLIIIALDDMFGKGMQHARQPQQNGVVHQHMQ